MLIIPIENKPDWTRPPLITLGLILLNLLVFLLYQDNDAYIAEEALSFYSENRLLANEKDHYLAYLNEHHPDKYREWQTETGGSLRDRWLTQAIVFDRQFDHYLRQVWRDSAQEFNEATLLWQNQRAQFEQQRNRLSSFRGGMTPAEASPWTFISSQFLHGGWDHLIGNMIFLFLFGFTLETALRAPTFLALYLASGAAANGLHLLFNLGSYIPVVGASGAISGLMGMYLVLYGLRKIRFFYTVLFYFGEFRAPALFILPLWLAKELHGHYFIDSNIAYWAHIGGLVAGAALMFCARPSQKAFTEQLQSRDASDALEHKLNTIQQWLSEMHFDKAKLVARQACAQFPTDPRPWRLLFDMHKNQPQQKAFHEVTFALLKQFCQTSDAADAWRADASAVLQQYRALHPKMPAISGPLHLALAQQFWRGGQRNLALDCVNQALTKGVRSPAAIALLTTMNRHYMACQQNDEAQQTAALIKNLQTQISTRPAD